MRLCFSDLRRHLLEGNQQGLLACPGIDEKDPIVLWVVNSYRPVVGILISGYGTESSHTSIVDSRESASGLFYPAIGDWMVAGPEFFNAISFFDIVKDGEYFSRIGIAVVEEKLCVWKVWVPVKHGSLLRVPALCLVYDLD